MRIFFIVLLLVALPTYAIEPLASSVLIEQCSSADDADKAACQAWVHGFIAGAFASRTLQQSDAGKSETFTERATRTRASRGRSVYGQNYDARYCVPREIMLDVIVANLNAYAAELETVPDQANQLVLALLRYRYPCA